MLMFILTILAWRKGWKGMALIPLLISILVGFIAGASGGIHIGALIILELILDAMLIAMIAHPSKSVSQTSENYIRTASNETDNLKRVA